MIKKIPISLGKMSENCRGDFFDSHCIVSGAIIVIRPRPDHPRRTAASNYYLSSMNSSVRGILGDEVDCSLVSYDRPVLELT